MFSSLEQLEELEEIKQLDNEDIKEIIPLEDGTEIKEINLDEVEARWAILELSGLEWSDSFKNG